MRFGRLLSDSNRARKPTPVHGGNTVRRPGITWDFRRASLRRAVLALSITGIAGLGVPLASAESGSGSDGSAATATTPASTSDQGMTPVWADPLVSSTGGSPDGSGTTVPTVTDTSTVNSATATNSAPLPPTALPTLAEVERVIDAQKAWEHGATGQGVDVAVIDTGVTPVRGLNAR